MALPEQVPNSEARIKQIALEQSKQGVLVVRWRSARVRGLLRVSRVETLTTPRGSQGRGALLFIVRVEGRMDA